PRALAGAGLQEAEAHVLRGENARSVDRLPAEQIPIPRQRLVNGAHHDGDMVDRADGHGRYSPHTARSAPLISPSVMCDSTQARILGTTFSVAAAAISSAVSASAARAASRPARTARVRATCSASAR